MMNLKITYISYENRLIYILNVIKKKMKVKMIKVRVFIIANKKWRQLAPFGFVTPTGQISTFFLDDLKKLAYYM